LNGVMRIYLNPRQRKLMSELEVFNLTNYFRNEFIKYDRRIYSLKTVKSGKWWKYFCETIDKFSTREGWDANIFIKCQFESFGKIYPTQLPTERAWNAFKDYKFRFENVMDKETEIVKSVLTGYKAVKNYCVNQKKEFSVATFLENNFNNRQIEIGAYPIYFFAFSKAYIAVYGMNKTKRMMVTRNKDLLDKIKNVLGDDFE